MAVLGKEKKAWQWHVGFLWLYGHQDDHEKVMKKMMSLILLNEESGDQRKKVMKKQVIMMAMTHMKKMTTMRIV